MLTDLLHRLRSLFHRTRVEEELEEELRFHYESHIERGIRAGLTPQEARRQARLAVGTADSIKEECRDARGVAAIESIVADLRYAWRNLAKSPPFAFAVVCTLALGIGANTVIYSFMEAILMRALPVRNPDSLVVFNWHSKSHPPVAHSFTGSSFRDPKTGFTSGNFPYPAFELFQEKHPYLSSVFAFSNAGRLNIQIRGQADLAIGQYVSGEFFSGLGVPPAAGRLIDVRDDADGAAPIIVVSHRYALRRFGEVAKAVGQSVLINDNPFTIAGVATPGFFGVNPAAPQDLYLPMHTSLLLDSIYFGGRDRAPSSASSDSAATLPGSNYAGGPNRKYVDRNFYWVQTMGRLHPRATREQAQAALAPLFRHFVESTADSDRELSDLPLLLLQEGAGGLDFLRRRFSKPLYILMTLVGLILAIACVNTANLLLARAAARSREMAVRLGLGAGRFRIIRQLLTEAVLLSSMGGLLGLVLARWGIDALTALIANGSENFTLHANLNWHVLALTLTLSMATGMLFGLAPAMQSTRVDLVSALKQARAGGQGSRFHPRLRMSLSQVFMAAQIAISLTLMVAAGLFSRTLANLYSVELGFNRESVFLFTVNAKQAGYRDDALVRFYENLCARLSSIPGVRNVSFSNYALVSGSTNTTGVNVPGSSDNKRDTATLNVGPGFFTTMQIPILLGREIDRSDIGRTVRVAVINEVFARTFFGHENPIGRRFGFGGGFGGKQPPDIEVIGIARNARYNSLKEDIPPVAYIPYNQNMKSLLQMVFEVRTAGDPLALAGAVREVVRQTDAHVPVSNMNTQARQIDQTIGMERTFGVLCNCFAVLALMIACVGLYGMMSHDVARRTNEIGIMMALGAERPRVVWMVLREVLLVSAVGLGIGLSVAYATSRYVRSFLFKIEPADPVTLALAPAALLLAALLAGYGPAWRASRVDPWAALRDE